MYNELLAFTTVPIIQGFYIIVNPIIKVFSGMIYVKCKKQVENAKNLENNEKIRKYCEHWPLCRPPLLKKPGIGVIMYTADSF